MEEQPTHPMNEEFYQEHAHNLVDAVIDQALKQLGSQLTFARADTLETISLSRPASQHRQVPDYEDYKVPGIDWFSIKNFTVERAIRRLEEFVQTWNYDPCWSYCIDYLGCDEHQFDYRHRLRVKWSIPTRRKPIPRATASVYFTFELSKIKPKDYDVNVFYVFETNRLIHRPGQSRFREKWLKDIVENKALMMQAVEF